MLGADGRLLVSVPTGVEDDQGWQLQRPPEDWIALFERCGFLVFEDELYVRGEDGWRSAGLAEARTARYGGVDSRPGAGAVLVAELRPRSVGERLRLALRDARHRDAPRRSTRRPRPAPRRRDPRSGRCGGGRARTGARRRTARRR